MIKMLIQAPKKKQPECTVRIIMIKAFDCIL